MDGDFDVAKTDEKVPYENAFGALLHLTFSVLELAKEMAAGLHIAGGLDEEEVEDLNKSYKMIASVLTVITNRALYEGIATIEEIEGIVAQQDLFGGAKVTGDEFAARIAKDGVELFDEPADTTIN